jgi:transposase InsO family protein
VACSRSASSAIFAFSPASIRRLVFFVIVRSVYQTERPFSNLTPGPKIRVHFTYGARRVWRDVLEAGFSCGLQKIERLMRAQALRARPRRRALPKDDGERSASAIALNALDRQFTADQPNRKWIADFTYVWTAEGWLYVAAVIDLFSRRVVGWSMKAEMSAQLVIDALLIAIWRRGRPDALLHHFDRGSQYTSEQFQRLMVDNGVDCSMSRAGNVGDKATMAMTPNVRLSLNYTAFGMADSISAAPL